MDGKTLADYEQAATMWAGELDSVQTFDEREAELLWFARVAEPYRGQEVRTIMESFPVSEVEKNVIVPIFENITGITVSFVMGSSMEVSAKTNLEVETQTGAFDFLSVDDADGGMICRKDPMVDLTQFMEENPDLVDPYLDMGDFTRVGNYTDWGEDDKGHLRLFPHYPYPRTCLYRKDWLTNPEYQEEFEAEYGYPLKIPDYWVDLYEETGDIDDMWTRDKFLDIAEFFYRPEEGMYGVLTNGKNILNLGWFWWGSFNAAGVFSPWEDPEEGWDREDWTLEPYDYPYAMRVDHDTGQIMGFLSQEGGGTNSKAAAAHFEFQLKLFDYAPDRAWQIGDIEKCTQFMAKKDCALVNGVWTGAFENAWIPDEFWRENVGLAIQPVEKEYWKSGTPIHDDLSYLCISNGSKHKEAAWLYLQFTSSKAVAIRKQVDCGLLNPIRISTIYSDQIEKLNEPSNGMVDLLRSDWYANAITSSTYNINITAMMNTCVPIYNEALYGGWSGEKAMHKIAVAFDRLAVKLGYMEEPEWMKTGEEPEWPEWHGEEYLPDWATE